MKPIRISWSSLRSWSECRTQYRLRYIERKGSKAKNIRIFLPGTVADRVMRAWLESPDPQPGQMREMVPEYLHMYANGKAPDSDSGVVVWRGGDPEKDYREIGQFVVSVVDALEPFLLESVLPYEFHPELRFETTVRLPRDGGGVLPVVLNGGIDIAVRESEERYVLYDLKATRSQEYLPKTLGQGTFYDVAFGHWIGDARQPEGGFAFVAPALQPMVQFATITDEERRDLLARVVRMANEIAVERVSEAEAPPEDPPCFVCDVKAVCPWQGPAVSQDEFGARRASFMNTVQRRSDG